MSLGGSSNPREDVTPPPPPKTPRAVTVNRDVRETKTPPVGVAVQIATPTGKTLKPTAEDLRRTNWDEREGTPIGSTALATIEHRTKEIAEVRKEFREELQIVNGELRTTNDRLFTVSENFADVRVELAGMKGALETILPFVQQQVGGVMQAQTLKLTAEVDINKAQHLTDLKITEATKLDVVEGKKWRRAAVLQFAAALGSGGALTILIAALLGKC